MEDDLDSLLSNDFEHGVRHIGQQPCQNDVLLTGTPLMREGEVEPDQDCQKRIAAEPANNRDAVVRLWVSMAERAPSQRDLRVVEHRRK